LGDVFNLLLRFLNAFVPGDRRVADDRASSGKQLAHDLDAGIGDDVSVVVGMTARSMQFRVSGIFYSGFDEYDRHLMYAALGDIQALVGHGDQVMGVEMKVKDVDRAEEIAEKLEHALGGPPFQVQDWYQLNHNLFTALNLQKLALVIILTLIIIVATVNMVSALTMMVTDKTREIAILKSMGATSPSVALVFQVVGVAIGGAGTLIGVLIGLSTCYAVSRYGYHVRSYRLTPEGRCPSCAAAAPGRWGSGFAGQVASRPFRTRILNLNSELRILK